MAKGKVTRSEADIYVGSGAGKKLVRELSEAKTSAYIISPFLSKDTINILMEIRNRGVNVQLITSQQPNTLDGFGLKDIVYDTGLIQRTEIPILKNIEQKKELANSIKNLKIIALFFLLLGFFVPVAALALHKMAVLYVICIPVLLWITSFVLWMISESIAKKMKQIQVRMFQYYSPINMRILANQNNILHSKVYIIDDEIAYMGSMNFTYSGMEKNIECSCRITDKKAIKDIKEYYVSEVYLRPGWNIEELGQRYFLEDCYTLC